MRSRPGRLSLAFGALAGALFLLVAAPAHGRQAQVALPVATDDPGVSRQWGLQRIGAASAWAIATGEATVIAVIDSGVDSAHPDLAEKVLGGADCVGHDDTTSGCVDGLPGDDAGHGTHVAGIAAAVTNNGTGVAGVAPAARLLAVRVLSLPSGCASGDQAGCDASGTEGDVADGVRWAADHGADVINLSLGSITQEVIGPGGALTEALEYAWAAGAIPVVAGGNDTLPGSLVDVPAVVVAATDVNDQRAAYSSGVGNVRWGLAAPGGLRDDSASCESDRPNGILSTWYRAGAGGQSSYACLSGTSMAAPFVSGALAVLRSAGFGPEEAIERMLATADDLGATGRDSQFGAGRLNLASALAGVAPTGQPVGATQAGPATPAAPVATAPPAQVAPPAPPTTVAVTVTAPAVTTPPSTAVPISLPEVAQVPATGLAVPALPPTTPVRSDRLPSFPLTLAVLLVVATVLGHGWYVLQRSPWGRRTPAAAAASAPGAGQSFASASTYRPASRAVPRSAVRNSSTTTPSRRISHVARTAQPRDSSKTP